MPEPAITVYTDGACSGNPGPGGWAWAVPGGRWESGAEAHTTNQRMELTAPLRALHALGRLDEFDVLVVDDQLSDERRGHLERLDVELVIAPTGSG